MKGKHAGMIGVVVLVLLAWALFDVPRSSHVLAEVTETTTEAFTRETAVSTPETTEESTQMSTTEDCTEEIIDEIPPHIELVCLDDDRMNQSEIQCQITVADECLSDTTVYVEHTTPKGESWCYALEDLVIENEIPKEFSFCQEGFYQVYAEAKDETGNETVTEKLSFAIDCTVPMIEINMGDMKEGESYATKKKKYEIGVKIQDLYLVNDSCEMQLWKEGKEKEYVCKWVEKSEGLYTTIILDDGFLDGTYEICFSGMDQAGNCSRKKINFVIDNTAAEVQVESNKDLTQWTKEDVIFQVAVEDTISGLQEITYVIKGEVVKKIQFQEKTYQCSEEFVVSEEADKSSGYPVVIEVTNGAGLKKTIKKQVYIDKTKPEISLTGIENGKCYNQEKEIVTRVKDLSYKNTKTTYYVTKTLDGKSEQVIWKEFFSDKQEDLCTRVALDDGYYEIYAVSVDSVGLQTRSDTVSFVIDSTAPVLDISGVKPQTITREPVTLQLSCVESFYGTNDVQVGIERTLDGETTAEQISFFSTQKNTVLEKNFEKDGTYVVTISARDKAGNVAVEKKLTFSVDQTKPRLQIMGTDNYQMWNKPITVVFRVEESFYEGNTVKITGTKTDIDGVVHGLELSQISITGKESGVSQLFQEDGIYELQIRARDKAGNENTQSIHFVIDKTTPEINGVKRYHGGYFRTFRLAQVMEDIFKDLTVVSYQMSLNGVEYNGIDEITREGKYVLQIHVQDELQNENEERVEFVVDNTPPKVLIHGISDGETVYVPGEITFCLENVDDRIVEVRMNGKAYDVENQSISYKEYGDYEIEVDSQDRAGNCSTQTVAFTYAEKEQKKSCADVVTCIGCALVCIGLSLRCYIRWKRKEC